MQAHPKYEYKYGVKDGHTHDHKSQQEHRDGDKVHGEYTLKEADGTLRTVKYVADKHNGFHAEVTRSGHATHPAVYGHDSGHGHAGHGSAGHHWLLKLNLFKYFVMLAVFIIFH